ncbi:bacteriohemerythrin [Geomonas sp. Red32]|uniref:bacteriohemerythrin n=1 Tax=Geomonas sp. Red32 TaxID=2912856 RepID=UPI00202CE3A2|nr:bacteriohemerythrin [Geomonas sp. Red32]MCM0082442.1 bacteriohemerythrin [Geomonas sp. Red32]
MPIIIWNDSLQVGIDEVDLHHRRLVELLNKTYDAVLARENDSQVGEWLDQLVDYATYHFNTEEIIMSNAHYPDLVAHLAEHQKFITRIVEIQRDHQSGKTHLSLELMTFLKDWLFDHIMKTDAAYGKFVADTKKVSGVSIDL